MTTSSENKKGSLVVFEGVDASGKTTMSNMLCGYLSRNNIQSVYRKNSPKMPFDTTEKLFEGYLGYLECVCNSMPEIRSLLDTGVHVVHDRYTDSIDVFRDCVIRNVDRSIQEKCKREYEKLKKQVEIVRPDVGFYLFVEFEEARRRKGIKSNVDKIMFANEETFYETSRMFEEIAKNNSGIIVDTTDKTINEVFGIVQEKVRGELSV